MKIVTMIQARMGSTRLPGKAIQLLAGRTLVEHVYYAAQEADVNPIVVIPQEDYKSILVDICIEQSLKYYVATSCIESDVLGRFMECLRSLNSYPEAIIRLTSDCPMLKPKWIRSMAWLDLDPVDHIATNRPLDPDGCDIEVFPSAALEKAYIHATGVDREHVTPWMYNNMNVCRLKVTDLPPTYKLSVDTQKDYTAIKHIMEGGNT